MKIHIIPLLLLVGIFWVALIAAHSHDWIGLTEEERRSLEEPRTLEESSGSGNNSAEEFMNEMDALLAIWEEEHNETDYSSGDHNDEEEEFLGPRIVKIS